MMKIKSLARFALFLCAALLLAATPALGGQQYDVKAYYQKAEYEVPMRDGVKLHTTIYTPRRSTEKLPFLILRTPYGTGPYGADAYRRFLGPSPHSFEFEEEGFIFVFQDVRGKFKSEGEFTVMRPFTPNKTANQTDESTDTYDTIEWLLKNIPNNNGRAGLWGISYPAFQTVMGMIDAHPALKAASPQASPADMFIGDDFHHNGAFRLTYTFSWLAGNARIRKGPSETGTERFNPGTPDGYKFFLDLGPIASVNKKYFLNQVPEWNSYMEHPDYDEYWQRQNFLPYLKEITVPVLNVAGWFDAEDFYGPLAIYQQIEKTTPNNKSILVAGPFSHGGWNSHPDGNSLGDIRFRGEPAVYFRQQIQFPFFRYYLKDKGELKLPEALMYETGSNKWRSYTAWPPRNKTIEKRLYFRAGGKLSFAAPTEDNQTGFDSYISDPAKPVPFTSETRFTQGHLWMVEDQRFASRRTDVLVYETDELSEDITISGHIIAKLFASTSGTDSDFVVKLIDVYPGNAPDNNPNPAGVRMGHFQMLLSGEVFRAKYRRSYSKPEPMVPDQPALIEIDLRDKNHRFLKGHRIMVQVQSSWFPVIDRNPQIFTDIYKAKESDFTKATQKIYRSKELSSHVAVSVVENLP
jgi:putative CocE/NonD family hydrolase